MFINYGDIVKGSVALKSVPSKACGHKRYLLKCSCGDVFEATSRAMTRNKKLRCPKCVKENNRVLLSKARDKRKKFVPPKFRTCNTCGKRSFRKNFLPNRNTCKVCGNSKKMGEYWLKKYKAKKKETEE